jgi:hypothetical protein
MLREFGKILLNLKEEKHIRAISLGAVARKY